MFNCDLLLLSTALENICAYVIRLIARLVFSLDCFFANFFIIFLSIVTVVARSCISNFTPPQSGAGVGNNPGGNVNPNTNSAPANQAGSQLPPAQPQVGTTSGATPSNKAADSKAVIPTAVTLS